MFTFTPISFSSKVKTPWENDLDSKLRLPDSSAKKRYRDRKFVKKPQPQELEVYLGWTTRDVVTEMGDLGYTVSLNIPKSLLSFDLGFGHLDFHFKRDKSIIGAVEFYPEIEIN
jgi:hypothetical protein